MKLLYAGELSKCYILYKLESQVGIIFLGLITRLVLWYVAPPTTLVFL